MGIVSAAGDSLRKRHRASGPQKQKRNRPKTLISFTTMIVRCLPQTIPARKGHRILKCLCCVSPATDEGAARGSLDKPLRGPSYASAGSSQKLAWPTSEATKASHGHTNPAMDSTALWKPPSFVHHSTTEPRDHHTPARWPHQVPARPPTHQPLARPLAGPRGSPKNNLNDAIDPRP